MLPRWRGLTSLRVGESKVRVPLITVEGPNDMVAYSHGVQAVDLGVAFDGLEARSYIGTVAPRSLITVVQRVVRLTRLPARRALP